MFEADEVGKLLSEVDRLLNSIETHPVLGFTLGPAVDHVQLLLLSDVVDPFVLGVERGLVLTVPEVLILLPGHIELILLLVFFSTSVSQVI